MAKSTSNSILFVLFLFSNLAFLALGQGTQFITGPCTSDADCASGCCGFNSGLCAGAIVAQERDGGCGFGNGQPNDNAAGALRGQGFAGNGAHAGTGAGAKVATPVLKPTKAVGATGSAAGQNQVSPGTQFITGPCSSDADCASACCGFNSGKCAGPIVAQERDGGCGFGDAQPNDDAAQALRGNRRSVEFNA
ncbi:hypothetical protein AJ78_07306 [Emergomyces pasteurianus Ep9510]|uniref:Biotrophy-associated secreted protein 2 n=1 Tax=Emergomyces pasteurianus Ep9510 TaxID=1447872 RepID=A0A1J9PVY5_9EURO|nr:hypothetical protein AJ78_07306 [Emergomyces pasteurianus Ep9510]